MDVVWAELLDRGASPKSRTTATSMRNLIFIAALCSLAACANNQASESAGSMPAVVEASNVFMGNPTCAISGHPIKTENYVEHDGQRAYFCCSKCVATGKKDPAAAVAAAYGTPTVVGNTTCPISGRPVGAENLVTWQGQTVGVCCQGCEKNYASDASGYTQKAMANNGN